MRKDLDEFMKCITYLDPATVLYEDTDGNVVELPVDNIKVGCSYLELDKNQYTKMLFEQQIKDMKYNIISITRQAPKYDRTHKDEDRYILEDVKVKARQVWVVMNPFKSFKCFTDKDEAVKYAKQINEDIRKHVELI
jgi:hypothetical protein